eukprot:scaffold803_cov310-Pinguiococcus_pyrenoidosus.AAC.81
MQERWLRHEAGVQRPNVAMNALVLHMQEATTTSQNCLFLSKLRWHHVNPTQESRSQLSAPPDVRATCGAHRQPTRAGGSSPDTSSAFSCCSLRLVVAQRSSLAVAVRMGPSPGKRLVWPAGSRSARTAGLETAGLENGASSSGPLLPAPPDKQNRAAEPPLGLPDWASRQQRNRRARTPHAGRRQRVRPVAHPDADAAELPAPEGSPHTRPPARVVPRRRSAAAGPAAASPEAGSLAGSRHSFD